MGSLSSMSMYISELTSVQSWKLWSSRVHSDSTLICIPVQFLDRSLLGPSSLNLDGYDTAIQIEFGSLQLHPRPNRANRRIWKTTRACPTWSIWEADSELIQYVRGLSPTLWNEHYCTVLTASAYLHVTDRHVLLCNTRLAAALTPAAFTTKFGTTLAGQYS